MIRSLNGRSIDLISRSIAQGSRILSKRWTLQPLRHASTIQPYTAPVPAQRKIPDVLLIYQAGTWTTTFLGVTKISTILLFAFTTIFLAPKAYKEGERGPLVASARRLKYLIEHNPVINVSPVIAGSILPVIFMAIYARPFVVSIHLRIPMQARESRATLARYAAELPATARIDISVMQTIPVPGSRQFRIGELQKIKPGLGRISNLGISETRALMMPGLKTQPVTKSFWSYPTRKFYVGKNSLEEQRSVIWDQIWSTIPQA